MKSVAARNTYVKHPVMHCLLSWRAGEQPTAAQARETVQIVLDELDLQRHQCVWALHQNTDNVHAHIAVNRIDLHRPTALSILPTVGLYERWNEPRAG